MRTFVISDAHGYPELIQNALDHGGFRPGVDAFVYAGDLLDRGTDAEGCIALVEEYATEVLLGNHDVAALLGFFVYPQDPGAPRFRSLFIDRVLNAEPDHAWKAATCVDGMLITHAGLSSAYERVFEEECHGDPVCLAGYLNQALLDAVRRELETGEYDEQGILGDGGPTWFRPPPHGDLHPLSGIRQVVGHTPPLPELEELGFYMVDPCAFLGMEDPGRFRYAVIEDGRVRVEEGSLTRELVFSRREKLATVSCS